MEKENYTAYDLEKEVPATPLKSVKTENSEQHMQPEAPEKSEKEDESAAAEEAPVPDEAGAEIARMVEEMGAEKVLEIIRGNRNAAIDQIVKELEEESDCQMQSGTSIASRYNSIFELAAMA